jgi:hypothetical protein
MNSRLGYLAKIGLAGCLVLVGTCWVSGQQYRQRETYRPSGEVYRPQAETLRQGEIARPQAEALRQGETYRPQADLRVDQSCADSQSETNGPQPANPANNAMIGLRSSALVGSSVKLGDGQPVGKVEDLVINEDGHVDFMVVSFNGPSEFRGRLAAIPWSVGKMDFAARTVTLNVERDMLRDAPIFFSRGTAWPNLYEPQWAASVHNYFGVETDIDQRIERAYGPADSRERGGNRDMEMRKNERRHDRPQSRDLEQRRQTDQPRDRHLDPKPVPMPDGNLTPEPRQDRNGERTLRGKERDTIRNNSDDEFSGKKSDADKDGTNNQDKKNKDNSDTKQQDRDDQPPPE